MVTGASKGIGRCLALGCAREGADVIVHYNSDQASAEEVANEVRNLGREALAVQADLRHVDSIREMFQVVRADFPRLDVLINNAGYTGWTPLFETTEADWDSVMDTNLKGTFFASLNAARWMVETNTRGSIVNVSTNCAALGVRNLLAYATSKAGVHGMTRQLAIELAEHGIRVNTFAPGPINVARNLADDPDYRDAWGSVIPLGRTADPDEMVGPALFLASDDSGYVTGQVFYADGGWSVQGMVPLNNMNQAAEKNS